MKRLAFALLLCMTPIAVAAAPLRIVSVSAPAINCVFNAPCTISVNDTTDNIPMAGGTGVLKSRTFKGLPGSPADGLFAFEYQVDLRNAVGAAAVSCIDSMTINFGPVVSTLDYNRDRKPDQVFVITGGGIGTIGIASAIQSGNNIRFNFTSAICSGGASRRGDGSFFWGLVSRNPPRLGDAVLHESSGAIHHVKVRVPQ